MCWTKLIHVMCAVYFVYGCNIAVNNYRLYELTRRVSHLLCIYRSHPIYSSRTFLPETNVFTQVALIYPSLVYLLESRNLPCHWLFTRVLEFTPPSHRNWSGSSSPNKFRSQHPAPKRMSVTSHCRKTPNELITSSGSPLHTSRGQPAQVDNPVLEIKLKQQTAGDCIGR